MDESKDNGKGSVWEKRLSMIIITVLIGYIASIAGSMNVELGIINTKLTAMIKMVEKHDKQLIKHAEDLRNQDNRLTRLESQMKLPKL
jgi:hypothetical protein